MEAVLRGVSVYLVLLLLFRLTGKRSLDQITTFDFVLLLIIGEATQQALLSNDFSLTNAIVVIVTLVVLDVGFSMLKEHSPRAARILEGLPMVLVEKGRLHQDRARTERVDESDVLESARIHHGLERMDQIKYAVLERNGEISIIPAQGSSDSSEKKSRLK